MIFGAGGCLLGDEDIVNVQSVAIGLILLVVVIRL